MKIKTTDIMRFVLGLLALLLSEQYAYLNAQKMPNVATPTVRNKLLSPLIEHGQVFGMDGFFENIGQYKSLAPKSMGQVLYGYEGFESPVVFTPKGLSYCFFKVEIDDQKEIDRELKKGEPLAEVMMEHSKRKKQVVNMEWVGANPNPQIIVEDQLPFHNTYGTLTKKAYGFRTMTYKELYPNIDVVFYFPEGKEGGFEYNIVARPGADVSKVQFKFSGDFENMDLDASGNLVVKTKEGKGFVQHAPVSYEENNALNTEGGKISKAKKATDLGTGIKPIVASGFALDGKTLRFKLPNGYDKSKTLVVDPWITALTTLVTTNKGFFVDYDYEGNLYVYGGSSQYKVAKYNTSGSLVWTFNGSITGWSTGATYNYVGDLVVDKVTGKVYVGQGFNSNPGAQAIRLKGTDGTYDNFISAVAPNFYEMWDLIFVCNNVGASDLYAGGGTVASNINFAKINTTSGATTVLNTTGIAGVSHDIVCGVVDPRDKALYSIYASVNGGTPAINNHILKNPFPYSNTPTWDVASGYTTLNESTNGPIAQTNGQNVLAVNANYLFYYDGVNLKAFNKTTGAGVGTALSLSGYTVKKTGGIVADACNNVYVGGIGVIKVYNFNGSTFNDSPADITLTGAGVGKNVYDIKFYEPDKTLYVSGDGFVAKYDATATCTTLAALVFSVSPCINAAGTITASITTAPSGAYFRYILKNSSGTVLQQSATINALTYDFTGLTPGDYIVDIRADEACSGPRVALNFSLVVCCLTPSVGGTLTTTATQPLCSTANSGTIYLSGNTGNPVRWETSTNGGTSWTTINSTATTLNFTNVANNQKYRAVVNSGFANCLDSVSNVLTLTTAMTNCPAITYAYNCLGARILGDFIANGQIGQTGTINIAINGNYMGAATFTVAGTGFTGSLSTTITSGQSSVTIPITYDGSGTEGSRTLTVTSPQSSGFCTSPVIIQAACNADGGRIGNR